MAVRRLYILAIVLSSHARADVITGRVVEDHSGAPIKRAAVRIASTGGGSIIAELETDSAGDFRSRDLTPGAYRLEISKPNYLPSIVRLSDSSTIAPVLRLIRLGVISGHASVANARVAAVPKAPAPLFSGATGIESGSNSLQVNGDYRISNLYPDNARPREFVIYGGEEYEGVNFIHMPGEHYSIGIKIPDQGKPFSFALLSTDPPSVLVGARFSEAGFRFEGLLFGAYDLFAAGPGTQRGPGLLYGRVRVQVNGQNFDNVEIPMQQGRSVTFGIRSGEENDSSNLCGTGSEVTLTPLERWLPPANVTAATGSQGRARVDNLAPTRYQVTARSSNGVCYGGLARVVDLTEKSEPQPVSITLGPRGSIRGHVAGAQQTSGFAVALMALGGATEFPLQIVFTGPDARFAFGDLPPGQYYVAAHPAEGPGERWAPETGSTPATVELWWSGSKSIELRAGNRSN